MSSFYGGGRIAQATVKVSPDLTGFQAQLQASVDKAFAGLKVPAVGAGGTAAAKGLKETSTAANALRGSLIGLSRVTPVTVFGLGLYGTAGIAAGLAIKTLVSDTANFEKQLNTLQAITQITDDQLQQVRKTAIDLGGDTSLAAISAKDAADALTELAKAGLSVQDALAAARGTLELAGAAEISAGAAARFVATELNAFKLSGDQAGRVVDLLAAASIAAQGSIEDFGNATQQVATVAAQAGLTVEQTAAALTELARAGITSSDAGTSLRTFLLRLIPTTKQAGQFVQALGVQLDESKTEGAQLADVIEQYRSALLSLNPVQRTAVLNQIFGQDAVRAGSVLLTQNRGELERMIDTLDRQGVAADLNRAKSEGLSGAFAGLGSNLSTVGIQIGELVDGPLESLVRGLSNTITKTEKAITRIDDYATALANWKPVDIVVNFVITATDAIPPGIKSFVKEYALSYGKDAIPYPFKGAKFLFDKLGAPDKEQVGPSQPLLNKKGPVQLPGEFGFQGFVDRRQKQIDAQRDKIFGEAADRFARKDKARRKRVAELLAKQGGIGPDGKPLDLDLVPTQPLQVGLLNAQISGSLKAELAADQRIVTFFEKRLSNVKSNKPRYLKILKSLQSANAAVTSVQDQINRERDAAVKQQEDDLAKRKKAAEDLAKARLDYAESILDARESAAALTETKLDDIKIANQRIAAARRDIDRQQKIADAAKRGSKIRIDALTAIQKDIQKINALKLNIKNLKKEGDNSGFTLADLFKATTADFNQYASNISSAPMTGGGATRSLFAARHVQFLGGKLTPADRAKLDRMDETNRLLGAILAVDTSRTRNDAPGQHTGENEYGADYYKLPPGQRAMERARRMGQKVLPQP
jgi:TP901 family phage tail tape measure protein